MKKQEAINCINDVLNSEYHFDESLGYQLTSDDFEWLEEAKKALEKQIPKRPIEDAYYNEPAVCPNCGGNIEVHNENGSKTINATTIINFNIVIIVDKNLIGETTQPRKAMLNNGR